MEDNYYASDDEQKMFINYFDALYLLNIVFKENKKYEFIDTTHVESIWNTIEFKYHKFCVIKAFKYELGGYEVQIGDEYKGVCDHLIPKENSSITYNPLTYDGKPNFKKTYWKRDLKNEKRVYKKLNPSNEDYIFVHDDPERNLKID